jgi:cyclopropane-fatty-acyl-phospholipid synthase
MDIVEDRRKTHVKNSTHIFSELLQSAGITINGNLPWDVQIHNEKVFDRILRDGILGLGESYMDKWWDCAQLDEFFSRIVRASADGILKKNKTLVLKLFLARFLNFQSKERALEVGKTHYDLGNLLFEHMLDKDMNYTCGYWKNATTLEQAQIAKLDLVCQKLKLEPGMRMLDIGCGWGALAKYAAKNYGVSVVGVTISEQQLQYARQNCIGLPIEFRFQDYRDINESFDRIASLGMFEHVGHLNYRTYMRVVHRCLNPDGLFLLHCIGSNITYFKSNDWTNKYIFPNGGLPSIAQLGKAFEGLFVMEDWHNFGADYDKTLMAWDHNFKENWETKLKEHYDERFYRMWNYYLLSCTGSFRARDMQLWQLVLSKGINGTYQAVR